MPKQSKSEKVREELSVVQIVARTGRLPIVSDSEEWINPTTKRVVPGIALEFGDSGVCELHPVHDAEKLKAFRAWMKDGTDERILQLGVMEVAKDALLPPFPTWDVTKVDACVDAVKNFGFDPERCLRYELGKPTDHEDEKQRQRPRLVKALEALVDEGPAEDADADPVL